MACQNLDATILVERPPEIEIRDGIVYVTDRIGSLTIRRCFRTHTFAVVLAVSSEVLAKWRIDQLDKVVPLH
jgi:hypothetical protein